MSDKLTANKKLEDLASQYVTNLDIDAWAYDNSKDIASLFTVDIQGIREALLSFYKAGFEDGYKVAKGAQIDDWGNLIDKEDK